MQKRMLLASVVCLVFGAAGMARADDQAQAIIDKAIKARGGEEALNKFKATTYKGKGMFYGMGDGIPFTVEQFEMLPEKNKQAVSAEVQGNPFKMTTVVNGDKGWVNQNGDSNDMESDRIKHEKGQMQARAMARLTVLKDKACTLKPLGDSKVGDKEVVGVKVIREGCPEVNLFFDKNTGLLTKAEYKGHDLGGQDVNQEFIFSDYKDIDGIQEPMKFTQKNDGQKYIETEYQEIKHHEKLDDTTFGKP